MYKFKDTVNKRESFAERIDEALALMADMAESVRKGEYPPRYNVKNRVCQTCAYFTLCRKREKRVYIESLIEEAENDDAE